MPKVRLSRLECQMAQCSSQNTSRAVMSRTQSWHWRDLSESIQRVPCVGTVPCGCLLARWAVFPMACSIALYNLADVRNPCLPSCGVGISMSCCFAPQIGHQLVRESLFVIGDAAGALNFRPFGPSLISASLLASRQSVVESPSSAATSI